MSSKLLPIMYPISGPDEYVHSRAKKQIRGNWYIPTAAKVLMVARPVNLNSGMCATGYQCQDCKKTFVVDSEEELYHECNGVK